MVPHDEKELEVKSQDIREAFPKRPVFERSLKEWRSPGKEGGNEHLRPKEKQLPSCRGERSWKTACYSVVTGSVHVRVQVVIPELVGRS